MHIVQLIFLLALCTLLYYQSEARVDYHERFHFCFLEVDLFLDSALYNYLFLEDYSDINKFKMEVLSWKDGY